MCKCKRAREKRETLIWLGMWKDEAHGNRPKGKDRKREEFGEVFLLRFHGECGVDVVLLCGRSRPDTDAQLTLLTPGDAEGRQGREGGEAFFSDFRRPLVVVVPSFPVTSACF
ncbi:hypothetical protein R1flu_016101 [Riccia fluitans]|uniref:Uncharacterized protein n=1 Tax=Riccia fluitans TaxID=41844 RepID=A0ABD1YL43_9MARC